MLLLWDSLGTTVQGWMKQQIQDNIRDRTGALSGEGQPEAMVDATWGPGRGARPQRPPATPQLLCWDALSPTLPQVHRFQLRPSLCPGEAFPNKDSLLLQPSTTHGTRLHHRPNAHCPLPQVARAATLPGITNVWCTEAPAALGQNGRNGVRERRFDILMCTGRLRAFPKVSIEPRSFKWSKRFG